MYHQHLHVHFVGIGGIGMSGIAHLLKQRGHTISGCDANTNQHTVASLRTQGCIIHAGNNTAACTDATIDVVVHSTAIKADNPELVAARKRGIMVIHRAQMLATLMQHKHGIAVAGSHGKTTTSSLLAHLLIEGSLDPTVVVGGHIKNMNGNARFGAGNFFVAEADESDRSFLHLPASLAIVTNIDLEHLETYTDLVDIKNTFKQFLNALPWYGKAIMCADDEHTRSLLPLKHPTIITYGIETDDLMVRARDINLNTASSEFTVWYQDEKKPFAHITLNMPGKHNVLNALAAITLAREVGVPARSIINACATFQGIERRFSYQGMWHGIEIFDDYGHHPVELYHTFAIAKQRAKGRLVAVFQPHRYTRTAHLWKDFINVLANSPLDHLIITDIYPASEQPITNITSKLLVAELQKKLPSFPVTYTPYTHLAQTVQALCKQNDLLLLQGAGNVNRLASELLQSITPQPTKSIDLAR